MLLYLAQLAGRDAAGLLETVRPLRLRHHSWGRGVEQNELEDLVALLRGGRSIEALDRPPDRLHLHF